MARPQQSQEAARGFFVCGNQSGIVTHVHLTRLFSLQTMRAAAIRCGLLARNATYDCLDRVYAHFFDAHDLGHVM